MNLPINKNIDKMDENFINKKKPYQVIALVVAFLVAILCMLYLKKYISTTLISYLIMFITVPLGFIGTYEKNGMDFLTYIKKKKENKANGLLLYFTEVNTTKKTKKREKNLRWVKKNENR